MEEEDWESGKWKWRNGMEVLSARGSERRQPSQSTAIEVDRYVYFYNCKSLQRTVLFKCYIKLNYILEQTNTVLFLILVSAYSAQPHGAVCGAS